MNGNDGTGVVDLCKEPVCYGLPVVPFMIGVFVKQSLPTQKPKYKLKLLENSENFNQPYLAKVCRVDSCCSFHAILIMDKQLKRETMCNQL